MGGNRSWKLQFDVRATTQTDRAAHAGQALPADWFGHPRGLTILFLTEMWEKFSFFGMRALLVYYMIKQLAIPQSHASLIYGGYAAFAYFTPILGGLIADRKLGRRRAVIIGGSVMATTTSGRFNRRPAQHAVAKYVM